MTSLSPGPLFPSAGINRRSLPVDHRTTRREIHAIHSREKFGSGEWPPSSPQAEVYDVSNTPAKMVLLNNGTRPKSTSHLRGRTPASSRSSPDPDRHRPESAPQKNQRRHHLCTDSSSPRFQPHPPVRQMWVNQKQRPPARTTQAEDQNQADPVLLNREKARRSHSNHIGGGKPAKHSRLPISMEDNAYLVHKDLTRGNKLYLWNIAKLYDTSPMKRQKQQQYEDLLTVQHFRGFHTEEEFARYMKYLQGPRKRMFDIKDDNTGPRQSRSAPASRQKSAHCRQTEKAETETEESEHKTEKEQKSSSKEKTKERHKERRNRDKDRDKGSKEGGRKSRVEGQEQEVRKKRSKVKTADDEQECGESEQKPKSKPKSERNNGEQRQSYPKPVAMVTEENTKTEDNRSVSSSERERKRKNKHKKNREDKANEELEDNKMREGHGKAAEPHRDTSSGIQEEDKLPENKPEPEREEAEDQEGSHLSLSGREGTLRPKSRLGNRPDNKEREEQLDKSAISDRESNDKTHGSPSSVSLKQQDMVNNNYPPPGEDGETEDSQKRPVSPYGDDTSSVSSPADREVDESQGERDDLAAKEENHSNTDSYKDENDPMPYEVEKATPSEFELSQSESRQPEVLNFNQVHQEESTTLVISSTEEKFAKEETALTKEDSGGKECSKLEETNKPENANDSKLEEQHDRTDEDIKGTEQNDEEKASDSEIARQQVDREHTTQLDAEDKKSNGSQTKILRTSNDIEDRNVDTTETQVVDKRSGVEKMLEDDEPKTDSLKIEDEGQKTETKQKQMIDKSKSVEEMLEEEQPKSESVEVNEEELSAEGKQPSDKRSESEKVLEESEDETDHLKMKNTNSEGNNIQKEIEEIVEREKATDGDISQDMSEGDKLCEDPERKTKEAEVFGTEEEITVDAPPNQGMEEEGDLGEKGLKVDQQSQNQEAIEQQGEDQQAIDQLPKEQEAEDQQVVCQHTEDQLAVDQLAEDQKSVDQPTVDQGAEDHHAIDQQAVHQQAEDQQAVHKQAEDQQGVDQQAEGETVNQPDVGQQAEKMSLQEELILGGPESDQTITEMTLSEPSETEDREMEGKADILDVKAAATVNAEAVKPLPEKNEEEVDNDVEKKVADESEDKLEPGSVETPTDVINEYKTGEDKIQSERETETPSDSISATGIVEQVDTHKTSGEVNVMEASKKVDKEPSVHPVESPEDETKTDNTDLLANVEEVASLRDSQVKGPLVEIGVSSVEKEKDITGEGGGADGVIGTSESKELSLDKGASSQGPEIHGEIFVEVEKDEEQDKPEKSDGFSDMQTDNNLSAKNVEQSKIFSSEMASQNVDGDHEEPVTTADNSQSITEDQNTSTDIVPQGQAISQPVNDDIAQPQREADNSMKPVTVSEKPAQSERVSQNPDQFEADNQNTRQQNSEDLGQAEGVSKDSGQSEPVSDKPEALQKVTSQADNATVDTSKSATQSEQSESVPESPEIVSQVPGQPEKVPLEPSQHETVMEDTEQRQRNQDDQAEHIDKGQPDSDSRDDEAVSQDPSKSACSVQEDPTKSETIPENPSTSVSFEDLEQYATVTETPVQSEPAFNDVSPSENVTEDLWQPDGNNSPIEEGESNESNNGIEDGQVTARNESSRGAKTGSSQLANEYKSEQELAENGTTASRVNNEGDVGNADKSTDGQFDNKDSSDVEESLGRAGMI